MGAFLIPPMIEAGMTTYAYTNAVEMQEDIRSGEQTVDPRGWTTDQWVTAIGGGLAGTASTVMALQRGSIVSITKTLAKKSALRLVLPAYAAYVVHDTVMNPSSDYYIAPHTPLLPGKGGIRLFGGDVASSLLTAAAFDIAQRFY